MHDKTLSGGQSPWTSEYHWKFWDVDTPKERQYQWDFRWTKEDFIYRCHWCKAHFRFDDVGGPVGLNPFCFKESCQILNELVRGEAVGQQS